MMFTALPAAMMIVFDSIPFRFTGWICGRAARDKVFMSGKIKIR